MFHLNKKMKVKKRSKTKTTQKKKTHQRISSRKDYAREKQLCIYLNVPRLREKVLSPAESISN